MAKEYNIRRVGGRCAGCGKTLEPGTQFTATLKERQQELFREDFCDECRAKAPKTDDGDVLCVWRGRVPEPTEKKKLLIDDDLLVNLFERLGDRLAERESDEQAGDFARRSPGAPGSPAKAGTGDEARIRFRYVVALILMRKKLLIYDRMDTDDREREIWTMHLRGRDEKAFVMDPKLTEDQIAEVSANLSEIMEGDF